MTKTKVLGEEKKLEQDVHFDSEFPTFSAYLKRTYVKLIPTEHGSPQKQARRVTTVLIMKKRIRNVWMNQEKRILKETELMTFLMNIPFPIKLLRK